MTHCKNCNNKILSLAYVATTKTYGEFIGGNEFLPADQNAPEEAIDFVCMNCGQYITSDIKEAQEIIKDNEKR